MHDFSTSNFRIRFIIWNLTLQLLLKLSGSLVYMVQVLRIIRLPFMQNVFNGNITAFSAGEPIVNFFTQPFWSYVITLAAEENIRFMYFYYAQNQY